MTLLFQPRGRAIQVEDAIGDRQPSMDIRRPRYRDSDVVIQVACVSLDKLVLQSSVSWLCHGLTCYW